MKIGNAMAKRARREEPVHLRLVSSPFGHSIPSLVSETHRKDRRDYFVGRVKRNAVSQKASSPSPRRCTSVSSALRCHIQVWEVPKRISIVKHSQNRKLDVRASSVGNAAVNACRPDFANHNCSTQKAWLKSPLAPSELS